ncbi:hypothetical protein BC829DRAFT_407453 [Chytridium lagenaria]|nr:hypothetical protein BC829DRAFT_407453 [Chytridium lagenaria]
MSLGGHDDEHGGRGFPIQPCHSEPTYSEDDNETVTAGMMAVDAANEESRIRAPPAPSLPVPIEGAYKIRSGQVMHDESVKHSNINSFFRRHWEHLVQTADNMSRKIDAGIVLLATYPEALAAKAYMSPGFQKHVPGFGVNELKRLNDCFIVSVGGKNLQTAAAQQDSLVLLIHENNLTQRTLASNFSYLRQAQDNMQKSFESSLLALKERLDNFDEKLETIRGSVDALTNSSNCKFFLLQAL